ncbi:MAG: hypothetical protein CMG49_00575 [Candidatus Marinimicrobia bacterium]|nr:hypothetical protein [Candidatus Neomarinimicrobiota bacterium]|tara:strand:- start:184 stop:732 length:549 start_codon:yes stop_codon:yes gene_type:complete
MDKKYNLTQFSHSLTLDQSINVNIKIKSCLEELDVNEFINFYKISNFWTGKFFIKRIINKIFKYQIKKKMIWNKNFWSLVNIRVFNTSMSINENLDLEKVLIHKTSNKRYSDIIKYKNFLLKDKNMGMPLYITGKSLNILGAKFRSNEVFILDGSRRLSANIILGKNPQIIIIEAKNKLNEE